MRDWHVYKWEEEGLWLLEVIPAAEDPWSRLMLGRNVQLQKVATLHSQPVEVAEAIVAVMRIKR